MLGNSFKVVGYIGLHEEPALDGECAECGLKAVPTKMLGFEQVPFRSRFHNDMAECARSVQLRFESRRGQIRQCLIDNAIDWTEDAPRTCKISRFGNGHGENRHRSVPA